MQKGYMQPPADRKQNPASKFAFLNIKVSRTPRFDFIAHVIIIKYEYDFIYLISTERLFDNYTTLIKKPFEVNIQIRFRGHHIFLQKGFQTKMTKINGVL